MIKIAVLVSGGGTNLQALIDAQKAGAFPNGEIALVMASNQKAYALERAKNAGIESVVVSRKSFVDPADYDRAVVETLQSRGIELVVLAGFLKHPGQTGDRSISGENSQHPPVTDSVFLRCRILWTAGPSGGAGLRGKGHWRNGSSG